MSTTESFASRTDLPPDIASSSMEYATRFSGELGCYFLELQKLCCHELINKALKSQKSGSISRVLEVGGGHCQLTQMYLDLGFEVTIQGSDERSFSRAVGLGFDKNPNVKFLICPMAEIPSGEERYDIVSAIRLLAHVENWKIFLKDISELAKSFLIVDFANQNSFNMFAPFLFKIKKYIEKSTRPFSCQAKDEIVDELVNLDYSEVFFKSQYFIPMGIHRLLNHVEWSVKLERLFQDAKFESFKSPVICMARKND